MSLVSLPVQRKSLPTMLPSDRRQQFGAWLFLGSLLIFFLSTILLYVIYAYRRADDPQSQAPLPLSFLVSTICLLAISVLVHMATRAVRRDQFLRTSNLLFVGAVLAMVFMAIQAFAMGNLLNSPATFAGTGKGVVGMVVVLAVLHALHVLGGVIALAVTGFVARSGRYDHERHFPVLFAAQYWHFLDVIWLFMLVAFYFTTGGF
jgi:cytochrome c oxidase subunit III